jgi:hypothetical protein
MKNFLVYHNPDKMHCEVTEVHALEIVTNRPAPRDAIGSRVWLITGRGRPRTFLLRSWFIVDKAGEADGEFKTKLSGTQGKVFEPMIELNQEEWLDDLKRQQRNFASGLQSITNEQVVRGLKGVAGLLG